jgi:phosphatidylinositol-3-phosphatase
LKKAGASRAQAAAAIIIVALVAIGFAFVLTAPQRPVASTTQSTATPAGSSTSTVVPRRIAHVIIILMENEEESSVIGNASAPYQNGLASTYALAGNYFGVAHPSLPNYMALIAGSTFGVNSDCLPSQCSLPSHVTTIASLLGSHGLTWKEYAESMPANCSQVNSADGLYWTKHNPFVYFGSITGNNGTGPTSSYCDSHVVSMDQFYVDLQAGDLPNYSFITPNICDDAHSCPLSVGDQWLSTLVPKIINSSSFSTTAVFITYDEGVTNDIREGGGQVPCILVSPFAKSGYVSSLEYSHYSLLATVESIFGLGTLGRSDSTASPMSDLFTPAAGLAQNP